MNKHCQIRRKSSIRLFNPFVTVVKFGQKEVKYVTACQVDRFFEQLQNLTSEGWLDTSPMAASTPSAQDHVMAVDAKKYSSQMPVSDLFDTTVSKRCQTLAEVSTVAKSVHRPVESEFVEDVSEPVSTLPASSSNE